VECRVLHKGRNDLLERLTGLEGRSLSQSFIL
jgi:hypothetical protein